LLLRGTVFTIVVPVVVGGWLPLHIAAAPPAQGWWRAGWAIVGLGGVIYLSCLLRFLQAGGTPMIFFARPLRFLLGEEPDVLVTRGLYERTRNPMYLGVLTAIAGQAIAFASRVVAAYAVVMFVVFTAVVMLLEEPHLRVQRGAEYEDYCRRVPRWL
jgi:protein-S-isoprenylcysteine O-methyltransferase Ste14